MLLVVSRTNSIKQNVDINNTNVTNATFRAHSLNLNTPIPDTMNKDTNAKLIRDLENIRSKVSYFVSRGVLWKNINLIELTATKPIERVPTSPMAISTIPHNCEII